MEDDRHTTVMTPPDIARIFAKTGSFKATLSTSGLFLYGVLGGAFIAFGGLLSLLVAGGMPGVAVAAPGITKLIAGTLFPIGLIMVVLAGGSLFTSDCAVLPYAIWQKKVSLSAALKIALLGYLANFVGAFLVAWLMAYQTGTLTADPWRTAAISLAEHKTHASFFATFLKGVGANWMVCIAIWMAYAARSAGGKILLLWMPVMAFVALGWEHSIANMFFIPLGMLLGANLSITDFLWHNLVPATLGNILGGALLVAAPYYGLFGKQNNPEIQKPIQKVKSKTGSWSDRQDISTHVN